MKQGLRYLSVIGFLFAVALSVYLFAAEAFTLPLGLLAIIAMLGALWLQQESH